jgi:hypothetical protein
MLQLPGSRPPARRLIHVTLALGSLLVLATCCPAQMVRPVQGVDPVTGDRTVATVRDSGWTSNTVPGWRVFRPAPPVHGAPVRSSAHYVDDPTLDARGFPLYPQDDQEIWVDGKKWKWDEDDGRWERD